MSREQSRLVSGLTIVWLMIYSSAGTAAEQLQASNDGSVYLLERGEKARLGVVGGQERELELPAGARIADLAATLDGWAAVGSRPADDGFELLVVLERAGELELPAPPSERRGRYRVQAVTLVEQEQLAGVAWIEGDQQEDFEVRAALWDGANFGPPEVVSPSGPGAQMALSGAVLADGSWLLVWAAVDGEDDEILWSVRRRGEWSAPARVHPDNRVPDITPALVATEGGALGVWSWFDGNDYRLRTARFDGQAWSAARIEGVKGSLEPAFILDGENIRLLYRTVEPPSWTLIEYDADGAEVRRAAVKEDIVERPLVLAGDDLEAVLWWPRGDGEREQAVERRAAWEIQP